VAQPSPVWGRMWVGAPIQSLEGGGQVKLIKRFAIAVGSLAALVLAGGAHMRF
jgi:hypothetical protein